MTARTSATIVLVACLITSMVADIAVARGWISQANQSGWNWIATGAAIIWSFTMYGERDR